MKKRIILIIVIALTCVALVCGLLIMNVKEPSTTEKSTTTTTTTTKITTTRKPIVPTFEHGDNLTDEDFYFIQYEAQDRGLGYWVPEYDDFSGFLQYMKQPRRTYYKYSVDFSSAYYICAYLSNDFFETWPFPFAPFSVDTGYDVDYFIWHKFNYGETVPKEIGNSYFVGGYILFDCTIERDILNDKECNYRYKYFAPLQNGYADVGIDIISKYSHLNNYVLRYFEKFDAEDYIFLTSTSYQKYHRTNGFTSLIEYNGEMYLRVNSSSDVYDSKTFSFEKYRKEIGSSYDEIIPYLTVIEKTDGNQGYYIAISIKSFAQLLKNYKIITV